MRRFLIKHTKGTDYHNNTIKKVIARSQKLVLNNDNGIFYDSAIDAHKTISHIELATFIKMLQGNLKNKTSFIYT